MEQDWSPTNSGQAENMPLVFESPPPLAWLMTYVFVCLTWIFFRSPKLWLNLDHSAQGYIPRSIGSELHVSAALDPAALDRTRTRHQRLYRPIDSLRKKEIRSPLRWLTVIYQFSHGRLAICPHRSSGTYFLLPWPGFTGGFVLTLWLLVLTVFSVTNSSPFIYFQF